MVFLLLAACQQSSVKQPAAATVPLLDTDWRLLAVGDYSLKPADTRSEAHLMMSAEGNKVSGSDGCNRFFGAWYGENEQLGFGAMGATRMACEQGLDIAHDYMQALQKVNRYEISGQQLDLFQGDQHLLRFQAK
ncbi:MAG: META domain-containing protein [gamma proteobacterium symbiont of Bathyaustriella thionipta]|nr:META domain-containing protein [gamma proteobacterium symbiont of Bathyaustriella thionipta]